MYYGVLDLCPSTVYATTTAQFQIRFSEPNLGPAQKLVLNLSSGNLRSYTNVLPTSGVVLVKTKIQLKMSQNFTGSGKFQVLEGSGLPFGVKKSHN